MGPRWRTLLTNSILPGLKEARTLVKLLGPLRIGLSAIPKSMFSLPVTTVESAAPFRFGGLRRSARLNGLLWHPVVLMNMVRPLIIPRRLRKLVKDSGSRVPLNLPLVEDVRWRTPNRPVTG